MLILGPTCTLKPGNVHILDDSSGTCPPGRTRCVASHRYGGAVQAQPGGTKGHTPRAITEGTRSSPPSVTLFGQVPVIAWRGPPPEPALTPAPPTSSAHLPGPAPLRGGHLGAAAIRSGPSGSLLGSTGGDSIGLGGSEGCKMGFPPPRTGLPGLSLHWRLAGATPLSSPSGAVLVPASLCHPPLPESLCPHLCPLCEEILLSQRV